MDIKEIRGLTGLSQVKFAERYGIPRRTIEGWEAGERTPPDYVIELLERAVKDDTKVTMFNEFKGRVVIDGDLTICQVPYDGNYTPCPITGYIKKGLDIVAVTFRWQDNDYIAYNIYDRQKKVEQLNYKSVHTCPFDLTETIKKLK